ncbi:MAG: sulfatase-like hydrolase/transferase [Terracidiphilus sp.]
MIKRIAQAWGFASILLLPNYIDLTSAAGDTRMRYPSPLTLIALAHLVDFAIVALVFGGLMALARKLKAWPTIRWVLMAALPVFLLVRNLNVFPFDVPNFAVIVASLLWISALLVMILRWPRIANRLRNIGSAVLTGFAIFALVMSWQLVRAALWRPGPQAFSSPIAAQPATKPRLVWILFDELAYKPTFETRDPSLQLPNLDRLRSESTLYTDMTPIAFRTTRAVPSLMLGRVVTDVVFTNDNRYLVELENSPHWQQFDVNASLIGQAKQRGVTTSIVGWYLAYCPLFKSVATDCYWNNEDTQDRGPMWEGASFGENVWFPLRMLVEQFVWPRRAWKDDAEWEAEGHIASVKDLSRHALATLETSHADLIFLHIPAPHPLAFWDRSTGTFATGGSYLDGLDYSDRLLGKMLRILEAQPRWGATTLIVQGDHSWRTAMWRPLPGWSAEDERVSDGGKWDPRPVLLIHAQGEQSPETVSEATSLMYVHDFVAGQIQNMPQK